MFSFLPAPLRALLAFTILLANILFHAPFLFLVTLLRILLPVFAWQTFCTKVAIAIAENWMSVNSFWMWLTQPLQWDVEGVEKLDKKHWYFVTSNHQSWADIFILQHLLNRRIPMLKFFLKQELIWVPIMGLCWWALDFPFMKRYTKEYLAKHPEMRGKDFESTRKSCEKFQYTPVAVFNFLEGTRFTPAKHQQQDSPYRHLLKPKAGGMGFVLGAMGDSMDSLVDITIHYPDNQQPGFMDFLSGKVNNVIVRVEQKDIPAEFLGKNYSEDEEFRKSFQLWVSELWQDKDDTMERLHELSVEKGWSQS
ncbi:MAG: acyltransferase [Candidatus Pelagadaptatus aseana]|uniref:acyltransferase n=1 Tax=Candidatus Pelagadaptatus aseana TaxID=3120508 RepID=UPI0039B16491